MGKHLRRTWWMVVVVVAGCGGGNGAVEPLPQPEGPPPDTALVLKAFSTDCSDFLDYTAAALTEQFLTSGYCRFDGPCPIFAADGAMGPEPMPTPAPAAPDGEAGGEAPDRVSGTNTQDAGVDEADLVKIDAAGRAYALIQGRVLIFDAYPVPALDTAPIGVLAADVPGEFLYELLLDEAAQRLIVLGASYDAGGAAVARIYDVGGATPVLTSRIVVDGYPQLVRRIDQRVYRISRFDVPAPGWFYEAGELQSRRDDYQSALSQGDDAGAARIKAGIAAAIGDRVRREGAAAYLPRQTVQAADGSITERALACDAIAHPDVTTAMGMAIVDSFDTDGSDAVAGAVINNASLFYVSRDNLYLAQPSYGWFFGPEQPEETALYRLHLTASGGAAFRALGRVDGIVNSSYQLSEYDGALRVASSERRGGARPGPFNHVTVLDAASDGTMAELGAIRDLAEGETIQGARFIGPRGFVVTFEQKDPLFALDLSDPTRPAVASALVIPGFSSYLMPLGDDRLLTIGPSGTETGLDGGVAVQLFDVSDLSDIRPVDVEVLGGEGAQGYSSAQYDPHAFGYFSDSADAPLPGTLSVPLYYSRESGEDGYESFSGFLVLRVEAGALSGRGLIDHRPLAPPPGDGCAVPPGGGSDATIAPCYIPQAWADPLRSLFVQDGDGRYLVTLSSAGLVASDAADPRTTYVTRRWPGGE